VPRRLGVVLVFWVVLPPRLGRGALPDPGQAHVVGAIEQAGGDTLTGAAVGEDTSEAPRID
jgi:hypothetical protein